MNRIAAFPTMLSYDDAVNRNYDATTGRIVVAALIRLYDFTPDRPSLSRHEQACIFR